MDINFTDPQDVPQPRERVKIEDVQLSPYPDGWRVKIDVDLTPFLERPNLEIRLIGLDGDARRLVAELSIIETMHRHMEFTMHIRGVSAPSGAYTAEVDLYYDDRQKPQDTHRQTFTIP